MKKIIFLIISFLILASFVVFLQRGGNQNLAAVNNTQLRTGDSEKDETTKAVNLPTQLKIPSIEVEANFEYVGMDEQGRMDVPKNADNVAWYQLGPKPGEVGSAVIAGHLDSPGGESRRFFGT